MFWQRFVANSVNNAISDQIILQVTVGTVAGQSVETGDELLCKLLLGCAGWTVRIGKSCSSVLGKSHRLGNHCGIPTPICTGDVCGCERVLCVVTHATEYVLICRLSSSAIRPDAWQNCSNHHFQRVHSSGVLKSNGERGCKCMLAIPLLTPCRMRVEWSQSTSSMDTDYYNRTGLQQSKLFSCN